MIDLPYHGAKRRVNKIVNDAIKNKKKLGASIGRANVTEQKSRTFHS